VKSNIEIGNEKRTYLSIEEDSSSIRNFHKKYIENLIVLLVFAIRKGLRRR